MSNDNDMFDRLGHAQRPKYIPDLQGYWLDDLDQFFSRVQSALNRSNDGLAPRKSLTYSRPGSIEMRVVFEQRFNAVAFENNKSVGIGIYASLLFFLHMTIWRVCGCSSLLRRTLPAKDKSLSPDTSCVKNMLNVLSDPTCSPGAATDLPESTMRAYYTIASIATRFVLLHEIGHVAGAHLEFLGFVKDVGKIAHFEINDNQHPTRSSVMHLLELDADNYAFAVLHASLIANPNAWLASTFNYQTKLKYLAIGIGLVFSLFHILSVNRRGYSHPTPMARLKSLFTFAIHGELLELRESQNLTSIDHETVRQIILDAVSDLNEIWQVGGYKFEGYESTGTFLEAIHLNSDYFNFIANDLHSFRIERERVVNISLGS